MNKTLGITLSENAIEQAIGYLEIYKSEIDKKAIRFKERLLERLRELISEGFRVSIADDIITPSVGQKMSDVQVEVDLTRSVVIARGKEAVFIEFGAGVYYNGGVGSTPNPLVAQNGLNLVGIGEYGLGQGSRMTWGYVNENGQFVLTHGTPCSAPMYGAIQTIIREYKSIAREVFG